MPLFVNLLNDVKLFKYNKYEMDVLGFPPTIPIFYKQFFTNSKSI